MNDQKQDVVSRVRAAEGSAALNALAEEIATESLEASKAIVHLWATGDKEESGKAGSVVIDLEETAVRPMLQEFDAGSVQWRYRLMEDVVDVQLKFRNRILARLDDLLTDRAILSASAATESEQPDKLPRRACDEAYVWIRRLAKVQETGENGFRSEADFLSLEHTERDEEIQKWKRSKIWAGIQEEEL